MPVDFGIFASATRACGLGPDRQEPVVCLRQLRERRYKRPPDHAIRANKGRGTWLALQTHKGVDLTALSSFMQQNFRFNPGTFNDLTNPTPVKRYLLGTDFNLTTNFKIASATTGLDSSSDSYSSGSSSGVTDGRRSPPGFSRLQANDGFDSPEHQVGQSSNGTR